MQAHAQDIQNAPIQLVLPPVIASVLSQGLTQFTPADYQSSLQAYMASICENFMLLQRFCDACPERATSALHIVCNGLVDALHEDLSHPGRYKGFNRRALQLDTYKMVIVAYLTPAVYKMDIDISHSFNQMLREAWLTRFPKQTYQPITAETIMQGFNRKWHECYITQAACSYQNKPDDCYELTAFRQFRDGFLSQCDDGAALIAAYYQRAPSLVAIIHWSGQAYWVYPKIWHTYLLPCLRDIENGQLASCKTKYIDMVQWLERRFLPASPAFQTDNTH